MVLFITGLLSATLLPGSSEAALLSTLTLNQYSIPLIILAATLGNTLGGLTNYWIGLLFPNKLLSTNYRSNNRVSETLDSSHQLKTANNRTLKQKKGHKSPYSDKAINWLERYGYIVLLLSWLPIIGDPLCLAAGWMRMKFIPCLIFIALGKALRYCLLAGLFFGVV